MFIPKGFVFDGASIPRIFWVFIAPTGTLLLPGLVHDYAFKHNYIFTVQNDIIVKYETFPYQRYWDRLFRIMGDEINGISLVNSVAYFALRLGGFIAWKKYRKNQRFWHVHPFEAAKSKRWFICQDRRSDVKGFVIVGENK